MDTAPGRTETKHQEHGLPAQAGHLQLLLQGRQAGRQGSLHRAAKLAVVGPHIGQQRAEAGAPVAVPTTTCCLFPRASWISKSLPVRILCEASC